MKIMVKIGMTLGGELRELVSPARAIRSCHPTSMLEQAAASAPA